MALVFTHHGTLYLVLDEENLARVQQHDPFDFNQAPGTLTIGIPLRVVVAYAHRDEHAKIAAMPIADAVRYIRRGYQELPSDHERALHIRGGKES